MFARRMNRGSNDNNSADGFDMYMTPAEEASGLEMHPELIRMVGLRVAGSVRFAVACAFCVPDAGPFGEIEIAIDEDTGQACGLHRLRNPDRIVKALWFDWSGTVDDAVGGVYDRIIAHYRHQEML